MMLTLLVVGTLFGLGAAFLVRHWRKHRHDIMCVSTQEEADFIKAFGDNAGPDLVVAECDEDCPCRHHSPHYHWIDLHFDVLKCYPNCFIALHPDHGIMFFDADIVGFSEKFNETLTEERPALMVLHTSMLSDHEEKRHG